MGHPEAVKTVASRYVHAAGADNTAAACGRPFTFAGSFFEPVDAWVTCPPCLPFVATYKLGYADGAAAHVGDLRSFQLDLARDPAYRKGLQDGRAAVIDTELEDWLSNDPEGQRFADELTGDALPWRATPEQWARWRERRVKALGV